MPALAETWWEWMFGDGDPKKQSFIDDEVENFLNVAGDDPISIANEAATVAHEKGKFFRDVAVTT